MQQETNLRNLLIAMGAVIAIMLVWQIFIWGPESKERTAAMEAAKAERVAEEATQQAAPPAPGSDEASVETSTPVVEDVRVPFEGPEMDGSLLLRGARIDQLKLKEYYETLEDKEARNPDGEVEIFAPQGTGDGYYASIGWTRPEGGPLTDAQTNWQLVEGETLTPSTPITLAYQGQGFSIERVVTMDDHFMFTFEDTITNTSATEQSVQPYGVLRQFGVPEDLANFHILHEGLIAAAGNKLIMEKYKQLGKGETVSETSNDGGWVGLTDKYWLGAIIPDQDQPFTIGYRTINRTNGQVLQARVDGAVSLLGPGQSATTVNRVYGGAKESKILRAYQEDLNVPRFVDAIDWGSMFFWLTKPFFAVLTFINGYIGNFGVSILILTVIVKAIFFPIQNRAYKSMAVMRELSEPMKKIRETVDDKQEQQRQIMELYREKKVNPVAGCLPILIQIPVFYGLYKTLFVTIEMRHEPFFLWIRDLSAPDPTAIGNLFGLLPISTDAVTSVPFLGAVLAIGVLPIIYGLTMWALQSLNPPPQDDTQRMIFMFLPIIFTFVFANFAAGLVIYWCWSNFLSILQQYTIMRRNGVKTELDKFIDRRLGKGEAKS